MIVRNTLLTFLCTTYLAGAVASGHVIRIVGVEGVKHFGRQLITMANQAKTFGTLRDLLRAKSVGVIEDLPERGLVKYAKPVGVVGAVVPKAITGVSDTLMFMGITSGSTAVGLIKSALRAPRMRIPTKPGRAAKERRIDSKKRRGSLKKLRGKPVE